MYVNLHNIHVSLYIHTIYACMGTYIYMNIYIHIYAGAFCIFTYRYT